jgi:hypothetical protein
MSNRKENRDHRARREKRIEFLGEQDGDSERELQASLRHVFGNHPEVKRAYLAIVGFSPTTQPGIALCLFPKSVESSAIVDEVGQVFSLLFSEDNYLDVLFVSDDQEPDLMRVCRPFYESI